MLKKILVASALTLILSLTALASGNKAVKAQAKAKKVGTPTTILHVITLRWTADSTAAQRQAALDGVKKMADQIPGIRNIWVKTIKVQGGTADKPYNAVIAIEFENQAALDAYAKHPAHDEWYKIYIPIRDESRSHDVTNEGSSK